ncbi:hypothetical protein BSZ35_17350 [Salinibacter sp. 10B]|uniref:zinc ribbon domain-containing protein n=1 Tax=Salinibacter sp. 10B TaxID=1923971 RepID=UPI000CF40545|nr:zinc ribbon domain-containing protein [Salinibacter sp. 10B]PQJ36129.1 hypothetical protein BSZ35_17350 [Salinibacter sp. 10B]
MADDAHSCPSCGAHVPEGAEQCDLCGTPIDAPSGDPASEEPVPDPPEEGPTEAERKSEAPGADEHVYCNQCGFQNPIEANYCSQCGTELQDLSASPEGTRTVTADLPEGGDAGPSAEETDAPSEAETGEQAAMGKQIVVMVGIGLVFVLGFFFATQWSQQYEWGEDDSASSPSAEATARTNDAGGSSSPAGPMTGAAPGGGSASSGTPQTDLQTLVDELSGAVDGPVASKIDSLRGQVEDAQGRQKRQLRSELVRLYIGAGAPGRAALLQSQIADATGAVDARRRAADLLYRWMRQVEQQGDRARIAEVARHVATAYEQVAEQRTEDLDARTRMGEAYLLTNNPMKGIQAINAVLEEDSTFVPARFQKGLALLQINRLDQAIQQFEQVKQYAGEQEPFYKQAERAIEVIREQSSSSGATRSGSDTE